jgi:hypothetical protein
MLFLRGPSKFAQRYANVVPFSNVTVMSRRLTTDRRIELPALFVAKERVPPRVKVSASCASSTTKIARYQRAAAERT